MPSKNIKTLTLKQLLDAQDVNLSIDGYKFVALEKIQKMYGYYNEYFFLEESSNCFYKHQGLFWYNGVQVHSYSEFPEEVYLEKDETTNCVQVVPIQQIIQKFVPLLDAYDYSTNTEIVTT